MIRSYRMLGLSKYVFYEDGTVRSRHTGAMLKCKKEIGRKKYILYNDKGEKENVFVREIELYCKHTKATEYETPMQVIERILYPEAIVPNQTSNIKRMRKYLSTLLH